MVTETAQQQRRVTIERLFLKDLSFSSPQTPQSVMGSPSVEKLLNIRSNNTSLSDDRVEVTLTVGVKGVAAGETAFHIEVLQAGVFHITGYSPVERIEILGRVCPEILFPFARRTISDTAGKAGFPHVVVNPLNFDALLAQSMHEKAQQAAEN